jgi:hypothetical protein
MIFLDPARRGDVSAAMAAGATRSFLQNHLNLSSYLFVWMENIWNGGARS